MFAVMGIGLFILAVAGFAFSPFNTVLPAQSQLHKHHVVNRLDKDYVTDCGFSYAHYYYEPKTVLTHFIYTHYLNLVEFSDAAK